MCVLLTLMGTYTSIAKLRNIVYYINWENIVMVRYIIYELKLNLGQFFPKSNHATVVDFEDRSHLFKQFGLQNDTLHKS